MPLNFVCRGRVVPADGLPMVLADHKLKPTAKAPTEAKHLGFIVEGYKPGAIADAERLHKVAHKDKPWDEIAWRRKNKPSRVAKPFSMPAAADAAKRLAEKDGWQYVEVRELIRGATC